MGRIVQRTAVSVWGVLGLFLIGCGGSDGDTAQSCQAVGEHLSQCLNMPVNVDPDACDEDSAALMLSFDCEALTTAPGESEVGAAKADSDQCNLTDLCLESGVEDESLCDSFEATSCAFLDAKMDNGKPIPKCKKGYITTLSGCKKACPKGTKKTKNGCRRVTCPQGSSPNNSGGCKKDKEQKCKKGYKFVGGSLGCVKDLGVRCPYGKKFYAGRCQ